MAPPSAVRVICIDEWGALAVKSYPGATWQTGIRATCEPDYGRRGAPVWVHGAFEPATGEATWVLSAKRDGASHSQLLEQVMTTFPAERWLLIEDNLSTHPSRDVKTALLAWPEIQIQFIPKYASWLNLIETLVETTGLAGPQRTPFRDARGVDRRPGSGPGLLAGSQASLYLA